MSTLVIFLIATLKDVLALVEQDVEKADITAIIRMAIATAERNYRELKERDMVLLTIAENKRKQQEANNA